MYTFFILYSPSYPFSPTPPLSHLPGLPLGALLFSDFVEEKQKNKMKNVTF
jgi:hypothetical protein